MTEILDLTLEQFESFYALRWTFDNIPPTVGSYCCAPNDEPPKTRGICHGNVCPSLVGWRPIHPLEYLRAKFFTIWLFDDWFSAPILNVVEKVVVVNSPAIAPIGGWYASHQGRIAV